VPIRKAGGGISIFPGWTDEYDWAGLASFEELPHSYNPASGFVCSANNRSAGDEYPHYISQWYDFNRGPFEVGGSYHTVCPYMGMDADSGKVMAEASQRHIYSLANWDDSLSVIPTGESGITASLHYCDQTKLFVNNEYHPDYTSRSLIEKHTKYRMTLTPGETRH
jgi:acyl-homoserine lactone acylase PvdQ